MQLNNNNNHQIFQPFLINTTYTPSWVMVALSRNPQWASALTVSGFDALWVVVTEQLNLGLNILQRAISVSHLPSKSCLFKITGPSPSSSYQACICKYTAEQSSLEYVSS